MKISNYEILEKIGSGGMGSIYKARDLRLDRFAAIKILKTPSFEEKDSLLRFSEEAKVCSKMNHPNVIGVYDFDASGDPAYIVFELVEGMNLKEYFKQRREVTIDWILDVSVQLSLGLFHAHKLGVIHRDLKPANILFNESDVPKIADFGLAKMSGVTSSKTKTGMVLGTPLYMSPEQASEKSLDPASDIYSFGVILFEMLAGTVPLDGPNDMKILLAHLREPPPLVGDFNESLPKELDGLVDSLLEKKARKRPKNSRELAGSLRRVQGLLKSRGESDKKVVLGRLRNLPRPEVNRRRSRSRSRSSSSKTSSVVTEVASAIIAKTSGTLLSHCRMIALWSCILASFALLLHYYFYSGRGGLDYVVTGLSVPARGAKRALLHWRSNWRFNDPRVLLSSEGRKLSPTLADLRIKKLPSEGLFEHSILISGLIAASKHRLALMKPDGSKTLSCSFDTLEPELFHCRSSLGISEDGAVKFRIDGNKPFFCSSVKSQKYSVCKEFSFEEQQVARGERREVLLKSIDGEEETLDIAPLRTLEEELDKSWRSFERDYEKGAFFRYFQSPRRLNDLFHEFSIRYLTKVSSSVEERRVLQEFWGEVEDTLNGKAEWFSLLSPYLKGFEHVIAWSREHQSLAMASSRALLPLRLINGAAIYYNLENNDDWFPLLEARNSPLRFQRDEAIIADPAGSKNFILESVDGSSQSSSGAPLYVLSWQHPSADRYKDWYEKKHGREMPDLFFCRKGRMTLSKGDLAKMHEIELRLNTRSPWAHLLLVVEFIRSDFSAIFFENAEVHRWLKNRISEQERKMREGTLEPKTYSGRSEGDVVGGGLDDKYPKGLMRYNSIPKGVLFPGDNPVEIRVYAGPVDIHRSYSFFHMELCWR